MDLVTGAMGNLAPKLLQLLQAEYKLQKGVKKQVEFISEELESISAALHKVGKVPPDQLDEQVRIWARQVREASYDMEDVLDTFLVRVEGGHEPTGDHGRLKRAMKKMGALFSKGKARHDIASIILDIKEQLEEVAKRRDKYRIDEIVPKPEGKTSIDPRLSALYTEASKLIGIDEPKEALIEMLSIGKDDTSSKKKKIVSVVGSGGLGKTTLAKAVYDDVKLQFDCSAFVQVGQNPVPKKVLKEILVMLINDETEKKTNTDLMGLQEDHRDFLQGKRYTKYIGADLMGLEAHDLIREIREFLQGKRYIIVVDDIWDIITWENIKLAFVDNNSGNRIVTTSRNSQVSEKIGDGVYRINKLSDQNSTKLFCARISDKNGDKCPAIDNLDEVSAKIIKKCGGVPLVIIAVASVLATKPRNEWSDVYKSIGFGHDGENLEASNMKKILSFSYYDLPSEIRTCMLYLSVFPEDYYVDKNMLIWKWIAEGLVPTKKEKGPFEVGEGYFHELVNRGLILPSYDRGGIVDGCRVHDFVLDLIRELSREQNFVTTACGGEQEQSLSLPEGGKIRRLALQKISDKIIKGCLPVEVDDEQKAIARSFNAIYSSMLDHISVAGFKHLRVLALLHCRVEEGYLEDLGKLLHLRYLGLTGTPVRKLPEGVGNLKFLQTLMLHGTGIKELPKTLQHRTELMCLRADETTGLPDWIGKLTSLVELKMYPAATGAERFVKELGELRRLRVLKTEIGLQDQGQARELLESLSKLREIEIVHVMGWQSKTIELTQDEGIMQQPDPFLNFKNSNLRVLILSAFQFPRLPAWINPGALPMLCRLKLWDLDIFEQKHMDILGGFPNLHSLELMVVGPFTGKEDIITCGPGGFQNLVLFNFISFNSMMINFVPEAMPRLRALRFQIGLGFGKHDQLMLDYGLENLHSLVRAEAVILCVDCFPPEVEAVEAAVRRQVLGIRPNNKKPPTLSMRRYEGSATGTIDPEMSLPQTMVPIALFAFKKRCARAYKRLIKQYFLFQELIGETCDKIGDWRRSGPCYLSHVKGSYLIMDECMDALENAFHGRILWRSRIDDGDHAEIVKEFWVQLNAKVRETRRFVHQDLGVHEMMENFVALERGLEILTTAEYQRLTAMWEEVQAQHSLHVQERELEDRLIEQHKLHVRLYIDFETTELLPVDGMKLKVLRFMEQWFDTAELAFHGRILRRSELGAEDHRDYRQEMVVFWKKYNAKYKELIRFEEDRDIDQMREHIAALNGALDILATEYPRLATMWEELQAAEDGLLPALKQENELGSRLRQQYKLYVPLISISDIGRLIAYSGGKVLGYKRQTLDRVELAVHGRILWRSETEFRANYENIQQGTDRAWEQLMAKLRFEPDRDAHQVMEHVAALERAIEALTTEYPGLVAMWEELRAEHSLRVRETQLSDTLLEQLRLYDVLISPETFQLLTSDKMKVLGFVHHCYDTLELVFDGRISWRTELGSSDDDDHRDYTHERSDFQELLMPKIMKLQNAGSDHGLLQLKESIAFKEAVLEKLTVEYPRLDAMLKGLKAELYLPAAEDKGTVTMENNVAEEPEEQDHCLSTLRHPTVE